MLWLLLSTELWIAVFSVVTAVYIYLWNRQQYFRRRGIPSPPVDSILSGNLMTLHNGRSPHTKNLQEWVKQYGDQFGYYEGSMNVILTSRLDVIRDVWVDKFDKFHGRKSINPFPFNPDTDQRASVFISRGLRWKRLRAMFEPSFNQKMTRVHQTVFKDSNNNVMGWLEKNCQQPVDFHVFTLEWISDIIERLCVGKPMSTFGSGPSEVSRLIDLFFHPPSYWENKLFRIFMSTYEFSDYTQYFHKFLTLLVKNPLYKIESRMSSLIKEKRKNRKPGDPARDILDLFVDYRAPDEELKELRVLNKKADAQFQTQIRKILTEEEILSMSTMTILAAVETTHTTLKQFFYSVAANPKCQEKLQQEIDQYINSREDINLDVVAQMEYLDWCLKENQRLYPVAVAAISRECMESCKVGDNGLELEKGVFVYANYYQIHRDPKYWGEDAELYDPERWNPLNKRLPENLYEVYAPFGQNGAPRVCPGRHFGTAEVKLAAVELLRKFSLSLAETPKAEHGILVYSYDTIMLRVKKRGEHKIPSRKASMTMTLNNNLIENSSINVQPNNQQNPPPPPHQMDPLAQLRKAHEFGRSAPLIPTLSTVLETKPYSRITTSVV
ncbi:unnamed protein product, partial [Mesorhabditis belari]|uniref:Cytochrome P450 n=1 Tax=Mesorhabditis belari TaxID=2138241 RepID=A0AAF3EEC7_9BILA